MNKGQLTPQERTIIAHYKWRGMKPAEIARRLNRHRSTISREIARNSSKDGYYRAEKAEQKARARRSRSRRNHHFNAKQMRIVDSLLRRQWSPEQISGRLRLNGTFTLSHETIYLYVWRDKSEGGTLYKNLRQSSKKRRKRYKTYDSRGRLAGKRHISERPVSAENRSRIGHWEIDTVIGAGRKHCLLTLVERKTRMTRIAKLRARTVEEVIASVSEIILREPENFKTITSDNGTEFHGYKSIELVTGVKFYFATPYHSWERGTNENTNGLIRQYVPKKANMVNITKEDIEAIEYLLNTRPRKTLGYKTPLECYYDL